MSKPTIGQKTIPCTYCLTCSKKACKKKTLPVASDSTHIPFDSLPGDMNIQQCDTIMSLVSIAENSTISWWNNYDYCENIHDGRGMTVSLVGFCSGTADLLWVFGALQKLNDKHPLLVYLPTLVKVNGTDSTAGLEHLAADLKRHNDASWKKAVWQGILHFYWIPAMNYAASVGIVTSLGKGFLYDLALNHGAEQMSVMGKRVQVKHPKAGGDERKWIAELISVRQTIITKEDPSTNSGQPDRCIMWNTILNGGNMNLERPIKNLVCYGDAFTIE